MAAPPNMPNPQLFFGPMLIGVFLNTVLYGILIVQLYNYLQLYSGSRRDSLWLRSLIFYLTILDTFSTVSLSFMIYDALINKLLAGPPAGPQKPPPLLSADAVVIVLISTPVQLFLAYRIRKLTQSALLATVIGLLALISFGGGVAISVLVTVIPDFSKFSEFIPAATTWLVSSAIADILITCSLVIALYRKRTGMVVTDSVLNKIIVFTVQTGLITAVFALADAILFLSMPGAGANFIPDFALSKLYTNTFLASLNARAQRGAVYGKSEKRVQGSGRSVIPLTPLGGATCFTTITSPLDASGSTTIRSSVTPSPRVLSSPNELERGQHTHQ